MKTDQLLSLLNPRRSAFLRLGLIASLCLGVPATAFAKKGGGKPGGGDPPPDPEPNPAPVSYVLTWLPGDGGAWSRLYDIDSQGVAVGFFAPGGVWDARHGIASFPDRAELVNLESVAASHPDFPSGWRLINGYTISDGLIVSGDLQDPDGRTHCYAMRLIDSGTSAPIGVDWFRSFSPDYGGVDGIMALLMDASEAGDLLIETTYGTPAGTSETRGDVWRPADGAPSGSNVVTSPGSRAINNDRDVITWSQVNPAVPAIHDIDASQQFELGRYNDKSTQAYDLGDTGMVVGWGQGPKQRGRSLEQAIRFVNGAWEAIDTNGLASRALRVNNAEQVLGISGSGLFLFSENPDFGLRQLDDLLDDTQTSAADLSLWSSANPIATSTPLDYFWLGDPNETEFGHICGRRMIDGVERGFILTPVVAP